MKSAKVKSSTSSEEKSRLNKDDNSANSAALIVRFLRVERGVAAVAGLTAVSFAREIVIFRAVLLTVEAAGNGCDTFTGVAGMICCFCCGWQVALGSSIS